MEVARAARPRAEVSRRGATDRGANWTKRARRQPVAEEIRRTRESASKKVMTSQRLSSSMNGLILAWISGLVGIQNKPIFVLTPWVL